jgi:hypothetical protein
VRRATSTVHLVEAVDRAVDGLLEAEPAAAAQALVGGDHHPRAGVEDAVADRLGREAAEDDRVDGADARAGEHRVGELGDHRQVDADAVAAAHAVRSSTLATRLTWCLSWR